MTLPYRQGRAPNGLTQLTLGGIPLPRRTESQHVLVVGTTGAGKTTLLEELIAGARARGDRMFVCDPHGRALAHFASTGDVVLNPFDVRSPGWSVFNEMRTDFDADRLARSVVPDAQGESAAWHHYAQQLLAAVMRALVREGTLTTEALIRTCTAAPMSELIPVLAGTPAAGLLEADATKALASTRFVLSVHLMPHAHLRPGRFGIRTWIERSAGSCFVTWRADMQAALAPLLATWLDILINAALSLPPDPERRLWLIVDELAAVGVLGSLEAALTLGRKFGLCVVACLQSTAQLDHLYGRDRATTLRSCFRTLAVLAVSRTDPDTAEMLSRSLGERELIRRDESRAIGDHAGYSRTASSRLASERLVLPSEISGLADLHGFLAIPGETCIRPIELAPVDRPELVAPFQMDEPC
jgi:type IV secretory pathway TraG/TraD family ATPase VirD4